jgi:ribosomal protein L29
MKINEVREHNTEELANLLEENRRKLFDLRSQAVTEKLENTSLLRKTKSDVARILMVLGERKIENLESAMHHLEATRVKGKK